MGSLTLCNCVRGFVWPILLDGDTIPVLRDKQQVRVRLHGIDTPEKAQPFGEKAKQFTAKLVFGKHVQVEVVTRDRYGRTVAKVSYPSKLRRNPRDRSKPQGMIYRPAQAASWTAALSLGDRGANALTSCS